MPSVYWAKKRQHVRPPKTHGWKFCAVCLAFAKRAPFLHGLIELSRAVVPAASVNARADASGMLPRLLMTWHQPPDHLSSVPRPMNCMRAIACAFFCKESHHE